MLAGMDKAKGAAQPRLQHVTALPPTYDELGIGKVQAARWQAEARVTKHPGGDPRDTLYQDDTGLPPTLTQLGITSCYWPGD